MIPRSAALFLGLLVFQIRRYLPGPSTTILMSATALCLIWTGLFLVFYGGKAWRAAIFPLLLLFFMVPLPDRFLAAAISFLQRGSADVNRPGSWATHIGGSPLTTTPAGGRRATAERCYCRTSVRLCDLCASVFLLRLCVSALCALTHPS